MVSLDLDSFISLNCLYLVSLLILPNYLVRLSYNYYIKIIYNLQNSAITYHGNTTTQNVVGQNTGCLIKVRTLSILPCICPIQTALIAICESASSRNNNKKNLVNGKKNFQTSMEPPTNCVADNNSANLAFMAIATTTLVY